MKMYTEETMNENTYDGIQLQNTYYNGNQEPNMGQMPMNNNMNTGMAMGGNNNMAMMGNNIAMMNNGIGMQNPNLLAMQNQGANQQMQQIQIQQQMQAGGVPVFPSNIPLISTDPRVFKFNGNEAQFMSKVNQIPGPIADAFIVCTGKQTSQLSTMCLFCTFFWACLLFPLLFLLCDCWWKIAYPTFELSQQFYASVKNLCDRGARNITLIVVDNAFNKKKADILHQAFSGNRAIGFTFLNSAMGMNYNESQYSDFDDNVKPIKSLPIVSDIRWYRKIGRKN